MSDTVDACACRRCGVPKPRTAEFFRRIEKNRWGPIPHPTFSRTCRECEKQRWMAGRNRHSAAVAAARAVAIKCSICKATKPATDENFPRGSNGTLHAPCKPCRARYTAIRASDPEIKARARAYASSVQGRKIKRVYEQRSHNVDAWRRAHPDRHLAQCKLRRAVRAGKIVRPSRCPACQAKTKNIVAYWLDFGRPLDVSWLCRVCHRSATSVRGLCDFGAWLKMRQDEVRDEEKAERKAAKVGVDDPVRVSGLEALIDRVLRRDGGDGC